MPIYVSNRQIIVPGEVIAEGNYNIDGDFYIYQRKFFSKIIGLVEVEGNNIKIIPLKGKYIPNIGDVVIGKVIDIGMTNWTIDINSPYQAILQVTEVFSKPTSVSRSALSEILNVGDLVVAKVIAFDFSRDPLLTIKEARLGKVTKGTLVEITPTRVPRVIGKKGSMIKMLKEILKVEIIVGKNGRILIISDDPERSSLAVLAIKKIEREAHISGLTDRVRNFIMNKLRG